MRRPKTGHSCNFTALPVTQIMQVTTHNAILNKKVWELLILLTVVLGIQLCGAANRFSSLHTCSCKLILLYRKLRMARLCGDQSPSLRTHQRTNRINYSG